MTDIVIGYVYGGHKRVLAERRARSTTTPYGEWIDDGGMSAQQVKHGNIEEVRAFEALL